MSTPIHDMTKREHEHRWIMNNEFVKKKIRSGVTGGEWKYGIRCLQCGASRDVEPIKQPTITLEEEEFFEQYEPDNNGGNFYSFFAVEHLDVHYVWTIIEVPGDPKDNLYALPGIHRVNKIDYVVCKKPWTDDIIEAVYMDREKNFGKTKEN